MPEIVWLRNEELVDSVRFPNLEIYSDGRELMITKAQVTDSAIYRCLAMNKAGRAYIDFDTEVYGRS